MHGSNSEWASSAPPQRWPACSSLAMSINIERILALPKLPSRAGGNVVLFVLPLLLGIWLVVPGQGTTALGFEVLATGLVSGGLLLPDPPV
jgi:hypothetical protein